MSRLLSDFLRVLFTPSCWLQLHPYSRIWDDKLNRLMDTHHFQRVDDFSARIGNVRVWTENYPYASFRPIPDGCELPIDVRPSRATILRAGDKIARTWRAHQESKLIAIISGKGGAQ